jgi:VanZ family protein
VPVAAYAAAIFALSSIPGRSFPAGQPVWDWDKLAHALLFAGLGALVYRAAVGPPPAARWFAAVSIAASWGVLDELHQRFTPGRSSDGWDALADLVGAVAGATLLLLLSRRRHGDPS